MKRNPYRILGVSRDADDEDIRRAYRRLVKQEHPDAGAGNAGSNEERFRRLNEAYETIRTENRRKTYERERLRDRTGSRSATDVSPFSGESRVFRSGNARTGRPAAARGSNCGLDERWNVLFDSLFSGGRFGNVPSWPNMLRAGALFFRRGSSDVRRFDAEVVLNALEAASGVSLQVNFPDEQRTIAVPAGVESGTRLTYRERVGPELTVLLDLTIYVQ